jgi:putative two-component system response regulator
MGATGTVLVVDDDEGIRLLLRRLLESEGYAVTTAGKSEEVLRLIAEVHPDLLLLDIMMPGEDGAALCRHIRADRATSGLPIVLVTGHPDTTGIWLTTGADAVLHKPVGRDEVLSWVRSLVRTNRFRDEAERMEAMLVAVAASVEARNVYREEHLLRVARYSGQLVAGVGLTDGLAVAVRRGALLHDIGMVSVPDAILQQPRSLTPDEFKQVMQHTIVGAHLCSKLPDGHLVSAIVRGHHERWQGGGYPDGLAGEDIAIGARIVAVTDAFDALTTDRAYRAALPVADALEVLWFGADSQWDPGLVKILASLVQPSAADRRRRSLWETVGQYTSLTADHF